MFQKPQHSGAEFIGTYSLKYVLHFMLDVDYREYNDIPGVKMRTQTIDERIKEE